MESKDTCSESLFSWIDLASQEQLLWAARYLSRRVGDCLLANYLTQWLEGKADEVGEIRKRIMSARAKELVASDLDSREFMRRMRGAWYQKKHRKHIGKQASFQIPESVACELDKFTGKGIRSRTQVLQQIIEEAVACGQQESARLQQVNDRHQRELKRLKAEQVEGERARNEVINLLLGWIGQELVNGLSREKERSQLANAGQRGGVEINAEQLLKEKLDEIDKMVFARLPSRRGVKSIRELLPENERTELVEEPKIDLTGVFF